MNIVLQFLETIKLCSAVCCVPTFIFNIKEKQFCKIYIRIVDEAFPEAS